MNKNKQELFWVVFGVVLVLLLIMAFSLFSSERPLGEASNIPRPNPGDSCSYDQLKRTTDSVDYRGVLVTLFCRLIEPGEYRWVIISHNCPEGYTYRAPYLGELDCPAGQKVKEVPWSGPSSFGMCAKCVVDDVPKVTPEVVAPVCKECAPGYDLREDECVRGEEITCPEEYVEETVNIVRTGAWTLDDYGCDAFRKEINMEKEPGASCPAGTQGGYMIREDGTIVGNKLVCGHKDCFKKQKACVPVSDGDGGGGATGGQNKKSGCIVAWQPSGKCPPGYGLQMGWDGKPVCVKSGCNI